MRLPRKPLKKSAFTLIEILVTITIIAILVSISTAYFSTAAMKGRDSKRKNDLKNIKAALTLYYQVNGKYPDSSITPPASCGDATTKSCYSTSASWMPNGFSQFMSTQPRDPLGLNIQSSLYAILTKFNPVKNVYAGVAGPSGGSTPPYAPGACSKNDGNPNINWLYCYTTNSDLSAFILWAQLENGNDPETWNKPSAECNSNITSQTSSKYNYCLRSD